MFKVEMMDFWIFEPNIDILGTTIFLKNIRLKNGQTYPQSINVDDIKRSIKMFIIYNFYELCQFQMIIYFLLT